MQKMIAQVLWAALLIAGCAAGQPAEATGKPPTSTANPALVAQWTEFAAEKTSSALGTPLPPTRMPTRAPTQDPFTACVASGIGVRYVIEGSGVTAMSITQQNDKNGTDQGDYRIPYCLLFRDFQPGDFVYISAQIIQPTSGAGSITCKIYSGNTVIAQATANGFASIATCSGRAP